MFQLQKTTTFRRTIKVKMPTDKLDVMREQSFVATFETLKHDELKELLDKARRGDDDFDAGTILDRVLLIVEGIGDADGQPYPEDVALEIVKANIVVSRATADEFWNVVNGPGKARRGN